MKSDGPHRIGTFSVRRHMRSGVHTGRWIIDVPATLSEDGRRQRLFMSSYEAAAQEAERLTRLCNIRGFITGAPAPPANLTLEELSVLWLKDQTENVRAGYKRRVSLDTNAYQLKPLLASMGQIDITTISPERVRSHQTERLEAGRAPTTINSEVATLRQMLRWAKSKGLIREVPEFRRITVRRKRTEVPTPDDIADLIDTLPPVEALLARLLAETGCRPGEAYGLVWTDINFDEKYVNFIPSEERDLKTDLSDRSVHVSDDLLDALAEHQQPGGRVFGNSQEGVRTAFRRALKEAQVDINSRRKGKALKLSPKTFRKAHATWQAMRGLPEALLQRRLGHVPGSRVTNQFYVSPGQDADRAAVFELPMAEGSRSAE